MSYLRKSWFGPHDDYLFTQYLQASTKRRIPSQSPFSRKSLHLFQIFVSAQTDDKSCHVTTCGSKFGILPSQPSLCKPSTSTSICVQSYVIYMRMIASSTNSSSPLIQMETDSWRARITMGSKFTKRTDLWRHLWRQHMLRVRKPKWSLQNWWTDWRASSRKYYTPLGTLKKTWSLSQLVKK